MNPKWIIRIGIVILFIIIMYQGYKVKKSYDDSLKPISSFYHGIEVEKFQYDLHGHAYRGIDDSETYYIDDPRLNRNTVVPAQKDMTLPKPLTIEDLRKKSKDQPIDEFELKGKITRERDDLGSEYSDQEGAYDDSLPSRY